MLYAKVFLLYFPQKLVLFLLKLFLGDDAGITQLGKFFQTFRHVNLRSLEFCGCLCVCVLSRFPQRKSNRFSVAQKYPNHPSAGALRRCWGDTLSRTKMRTQKTDRGYFRNSSESGSAIGFPGIRHRNPAGVLPRSCGLQRSAPL